MASDYLLEIDGIKGESQDDRHKDAIEISSFSWGATNASSASHGNGGGAGKVVFQDIHFTSTVSKASPLLLKACATGQHIKKATLTVRKAGKGQQDYYKVTMSELLISSYQSGGSGGESSEPTDQFSLNFSKIELNYTAQSADGSLGDNTTAGWDLATNKGT